MVLIGSRLAANSQNSFGCSRRLGMKHQFVDTANVDVNVKMSIEDSEQIIDKVVDGAVTIIAVATVAHIFRKWVT
jgi:hypothetical protein